jgi:hypothetical protein
MMISLFLPRLACLAEEAGLTSREAFLLLWQGMTYYICTSILPVNCDISVLLGAHNIFQQEEAPVFLIFINS